MRFLVACVATIVLGGFAPAWAAEEADWIEYVNREDQFSLVFPKFPRVEATTFLSAFETPWPARKYTSEHAGYTYSMTVVDMSTSTLTPDDDRFRNLGRPGTERRGAIAHAAAQFRQIGEVTIDTYEESQAIPGYKLEIDLPDGRKNIVQLNIHDKRLYILECISPPGATPGYDVQGSLAILDATGNAPRYVDNGYTFPDNMKPAVAFAPSGIGLDEGAGPTTARESVVEGEWFEYVNREDRFSLALPRFPTVEAITFMSAFETPWPGRTYTSQHEGYTYRITVVDISSTTLTPDDERYRSLARPGTERRGSMALAAAALRRTGKVTLDTYEELQVIPGHKLEIDLPDGGKNLVQLHIHDRRLYVLECISPPGAVAGYDVQGSFAILDENGIAPRYVDNGYSFPDNMQVIANSSEANGVDPELVGGPTSTPESVRRVAELHGGDLQ